MKKTKNTFLIIVIILLIFIILSLIFYGTPIFTFEFFDYSRSWLSSKLHIHKHLITAFSFPLGIWFYYLFKLITSPDKNKQQKGLYLFAIFMFLFSLILYFIEKDWNFEVTTGEANISFVRVNGKLIKVPSTYIYDPVFGVKTIPATTELIKQYEKQQGNIDFNSVGRKIPTKNSRFFDSETGQPLLWYYQRSNGKLEFFDYSGNHPQFSNVKLAQVTDEIVLKLFDYIDNKQDSMIIGKQDVLKRIKSINTEYNVGKGSKEASKYFNSLIEK